MREIHSSGQENGNTLTKNNFSIVVIGGSSGSFNAIKSLLRNVTQELQAAILIVIHVSPTSNVSILIQHLQQHSVSPCKITSDCETIMRQTVYFSGPQVHLLVSANEKIILGKGGNENRFTRSINVLFRPAAVHFRERVIGIVLSGYLDDGAVGMNAIKKCGGGLCIVQDPADAQNADLPSAVIDHVKKIDDILPVDKMGEII